MINGKICEINYYQHYKETLNKFIDVLSTDSYLNYLTKIQYDAFYRIKINLI